MTAAEWLACRDPETMLNATGFEPSGRKLLLLAVACCQRVRWVIEDDRTDRAVEVAARWVGGEASEGDFRASLAGVQAVLRLHYEGAGGTYGPFARYKAARAVARLADPPSVRSASSALDDAANAVGEREWYGYGATDWSEDHIVAVYAGFEKAEQAVLVREVFGNPFYPAAFDPDWRTAAAVALARTIYTDRTWDRLPVLADALEDAGCDDAAVLGHLRGSGPHVRGCWVVDGVLGKA